MATPVPNIMAAATPCNPRRRINTRPFGAKAEESDTKVYRIVPEMKTRFLPWISANLPKGTRNIAAARRYEVATQLRAIASSENARPIEGRAMFTVDAMKGVMKDAEVETSRAAFFSSRVTVASEECGWNQPEQS